VAPAELDFTLKRSGFQIAESCGVKFNLLTMCWGVNADLGTNYPRFHDG
jgi:hypothetical protein